MSGRDVPRVVVFSPYGRGAGSVRTRVHEWLERFGAEFDVHGFLGRYAAGWAEISREPLAAARAQWSLHAPHLVNGNDVVLIHREASPLSDGRVEGRLLANAGWGVVDLDDGLQWDWGHGGLARRLRPKAKKVIRMIRAADVVIAGNDLIAEWASTYSQAVVVIPTCVEPSKYVRKNSYELGATPRLGWIGSAASEAQLASMCDQLLDLHVRTGARIEIVGDPRPKLGRLETIVDRVTWSEGAAYSAPARWDVGLMPVPDGLMERAKCGYKVLQYGAAGLPVACSPVGVNAEILRGDHSSLIDQLDKLLVMTTAERERVGAAVRELVYDRYSYDAHQTLWASTVFGPRDPSEWISA